jgi:hypothetical protein
MIGLRVNEKGESGLGVLGIVLLLILVVAVVILGLAAYKHFHKSADIVTGNVPTASVNAPTAASQSQTPAPQSTESTTGTTSIKITQLGINMTISNSINDLIYTPGTLKSKPTANTAILSTTTLSNLDPACGLDTAKTSAAIQGIGQLYEYPGTFTASTNPDKTAVFSKQFPSFLIAYNAPASDCSATASTNTKAQSQIAALKSALSTITAIQP